MKTNQHTASTPASREEPFKDWKTARERSEQKVALIGWLMVMIIATAAGFLIGFIAKH